MVFDYLVCCCVPSLADNKRIIELEREKKKEKKKMEVFLNFRKETLPFLSLSIQLCVVGNPDFLKDWLLFYSSFIIECSRAVREQREGGFSQPEDSL
jgi:hypothetical protein